MRAGKRVGIVGGGIFGLSCALELARDHEVTVFEQQPDVLRGATYANHNRHHFGFHYPRSPETALQCLAGRESFERLYGDCLVMDFANYYCISRTQSKVTPEAYVRYCDQVGIRYREEWPEDGVLNKDKIALCLRVEEGVYDYQDFRRLILQRIAAAPNITIRCQQQVVGGKMLPSGGKALLVRQPDGQVEPPPFDIVINAMYANYNRFCEWFGFKPKLFQYNLQELSIIELPVKEQLGITVQDGPFPSFLPLGRTNLSLLAHVEASQLIRDLSSGTTPLLNRVSYVESNWEKVQAVCAEYMPILHRCRYVRSLFVDRVVDGTRLTEDARLTDITAHGNGCWSVFAAKIITCEMTAHEVGAQIRAND